MNLLYFHQHFSTPEGSSGTRSYEFAKALVQRGHQVTVVCGAYHHGGGVIGQNENGREFRTNIDGIDIIRFPLSYSNRDSLSRRTFTFLLFAVRSLRIVLKADYDMVFTTSTPLTAGIPGIVTTYLRRKPFVFEVRDLWPDLPKALGLRNPLLIGGMSLLERASYRSAIACVGLSPGIVEGIRGRSQLGKPIAMIPNGSDLDLFRPGDRNDLRLPGIDNRDFVAVFTGAHGVANGLEAILQTAQVLKNRGSARIKLACIGDGKERDRLTAEARTKNLNNCLFLPPIPKHDLAAILGSTNCGLMILKNVPAFYYGTSPNKFFDYISAGLPVINNYPGWLADLISEYRCGMAVPPDNPSAFADALEFLASHPEESRLMGINARKLGEQLFDRRQLAKLFVDFLEAQWSTHNKRSSDN